MNVPAAALAILTCLTIAPALAAATPFVWGICTSRPAEDEAAIRELGATSCRVELGWAGIERSPGRYALPRSLAEKVTVAQALNPRPLYLLAYGHPAFDAGSYPVSPAATAAFARYAKWTVGSLDAAAPLVEVWNEWNYRIGTPPGTPPGEPEAYVRLLAAASGAIKNAAPKAKVLGGSMALDGRKMAWLARACEAGLLRHLDGLSFHPYSFSEPLAASRQPEARLTEQLRFVIDTIAPFEAPDRPTPLYLTELGWSSVTPYGLPELENQARWLSRALFLLRANARVRGVWIFCLRDAAEASPEPDANLGLLYADGSPKPAFAAVRDTIATLKTAARVEPCADFNAANADAAFAVRITHPDARVSFAVWAATAEDRCQITIDASRKTTRARQRLIGSAGVLPATPAEGLAYRFTISDAPLVVGPFPADSRLRNDTKLR